MSPAVFDAIDAYRKLLGTVSDCDIAREAGVSRVHVGLFRRMHGIPAYTGYLFASGHAPAGTPAASLPTAALPPPLPVPRVTQPPRFVYIAVNAAGVRQYVVAASMAEAGWVAESRGVGIRSVEWLGEALESGEKPHA